MKIDPMYGMRQAQKIAKAAGGPTKKKYNIDEVKSYMLRVGKKKQIVPGMGIVEIDIPKRPGTIQKPGPEVVEKKEKKEVKNVTN